MSAYSTLYVTRSRAKQIMLEKLIGDISDAELERFMDEQLEPRLYNCHIVPDGVDNNDDEI